ncbi:hypothetical protein C8Q79DRAFT_230040 [Trametes meyenii]|nr:hypothetical protein C8Q79DRAFT_230040 [Trametes meyenii]
MIDGVLYFGVLLTANLIGLGLIRFLYLIQPMSTWIAIFTSIMTARFILNLHEAADPFSEDDLSALDVGPGTLSTTVFQGRVGPPLSYSQSESASGSDSLGPRLGVVFASGPRATTRDWHADLEVKPELGERYGLEQHRSPSTFKEASTRCEEEEDKCENRILLGGTESSSSNGRTSSQFCGYESRL